MFYAFKIKWWRVIGWILLLLFLTVGGYYMTQPGEADFMNSVPSGEEMKAWQV